MATVDRQAKLRRLVVSPHLDDAVLSCWRAVSDVDAAVTVVTIFAGRPAAGASPGAWDRVGSDEEPSVTMKMRQVEDRRALMSCGASVVHRDLLDEQYRAAPPSFSVVEAAIEALAHDSDEVWIPAGIGGHVDHLMVAKAGLRAARGRRRVLYADLPYAARDGAIAEATACDGVSFEPQAKLLATSPFVPARVRPQTSELTPPEWEAKRTAVRYYQSQLLALCNEFGPILDGPAALGTEVWWDLGVSPEPRPPAELLPRGSFAQISVGDGPFLSVLLRTQGQRPAQLAEALASLASQSDDSFEVLVLCHDVTPTQRGAVEKLVADQPAGLATRTRILAVSGGMRGRPLNAGARVARGRYVAVLDDDDFALPGWVASFARLAAAHPGFIARAGVRPVCRVGDRWEDSGGFPADFDLVDHLVGNRTPVCGLAFPRRAFRELGLAFDEALPVLEDWEFLLRAAPLCGVASSADVTSVYRKWDQADDSQSQHSPAEFAVAGRAVVEGADEVPLLLPPGAVSLLRRDRMAAESVADELDRTRSGHEGEMASLRAEHDRELSDVRAEAAAGLRTLEAEIADVRSSTSWKLTAPLRAVGAMWLRLRGPHAGNPPPVPIHPAPGSPTTWPVTYFDDLYAQSPDPWGFASKWYERRKYALTLAALPADRYRRAYEPGCSIGVLTEMLSARCDTLIASDFAPAAVEAAGRRLRNLPHVDVQCLASPAEWPEGTFDLVVVSELAGYFDDADLRLLVSQVARSLETNGHLVLVHFRHQGETPQSAEDVHAAFRASSAFAPVAGHVEPEFLLDVLARTEHHGS